MIKYGCFNTLMFLFVFCFAAPLQASEDPFRGPFEQASAPYFSKISQRHADKGKPQTLFQNLAIKGLVFFQKTISSADGNRCPMVPSCSSYGIHAINKHGFFLGAIMTAARLTQERGEMKIAPKVYINGTYRFYDPLENNDFWFDTPQSNRMKSLKYRAVDF